MYYLTEGSPPPVRGILSCNNRCSVKNGLTPACAGNTACSLMKWVIPWAHPRLCGEYSLSQYRNMRLWGSPPPVRGIHAAGCHLPGERRLTPACAGNTIFICILLCAHRAHPRLCGEYCHVSGDGRRLTGSPPPVREYFSKCLFILNTSGSPPPVRGILKFQHPITGKPRLTPACAGNTD